MPRAAYAFFAAGAVVIILGLIAYPGDPEVGSRADLDEQIESLDLPAGMVALGEYYTGECDDNLGCPTLVRWYDLTETPEALEPEILTRLRAAGVEGLHQTETVSLISGKRGDYMFHVVLDQHMIDGNEFASAGAEAEVVVSKISID